MPGHTVGEIVTTANGKPVEIILKDGRVIKGRVESPEEDRSFFDLKVVGPFGVVQYLDVSGVESFK